MRSWKKYLTVLLAGILLLVLQACSTGGSKSDGKADGDKADGKAEEGGTLTVVRLSDATGLDPHFITDIPSANVIHGKVYETLVQFDKDMNIKPLLATEWEQPDDLTWKFTLKEGVKFHDGSDFNADAVKKTLDRILDPATGSPQSSKLGMISEVIAEDPTHVTLKLSEPYAPLLSILASNEGSIISPEAVGESAEKLATHPVGTGPFVFESWKSGQDITLVKNKDYWGTPVKLDKVVFKVVPEDATRLAMIEQGEAQISDQVPVTEIDRIEASDTLNLYRTEGLAVEYVGFNTTVAPFNDVKVRKAVSYAIEREAILSGVYNDVGTLANVAMSPKVFGYSKDVEAYPYDITEAKKLMKEAGLENGVSVKLLTSDRKERINMAEVIQSQLKGIGVNVEIQVMEYGAYIDEVDGGKHQMFIGGWGNATGDGDYNQYNLFHSDSIGSPGNHFYYQNPEVDKLIEQGRVEMEPAKREEIYKEAMQKEMDDAVYVPIRNYEHLAVYNNDVKDFYLNPSNYLIINETTVSR
ncbi:glutathione ABC transporter substrate-binding protein [Sporosarcina sp. NCCP-2716]|uniref:glutathione ABC transporter substrate-binding protein n=1 Tax=Sporosarcina sp. NCCP-2716 TaxID=2943679 RepID=UPI00203EF0D8|nr:glutathione ABC transporter substrate-binding protein [Sporosarcina sp. NCCP-2716]GKV70562.1 glutathione ABC transporter substrate-binding protein [Sporosarcina sp. NCCP-2716]